MAIVIAYFALIPNEPKILKKRAPSPSGLAKLWDCLPQSVKVSTNSNDLSKDDTTNIPSAVLFCNNAEEVLATVKCLKDLDFEWAVRVDGVDYSLGKSHGFIVVDTALKPGYRLAKSSTTVSNPDYGGHAVSIYRWRCL